jgi:NAD+ kinase
MLPNLFVFNFQNFSNILREKLGWGLPHISKPTSVELP